MTHTTEESVEERREYLAARDLADDIFRFLYKREAGLGPMVNTEPPAMVVLRAMGMLAYDVGCGPSIAAGEAEGSPREVVEDALFIISKEAREIVADCEAQLFGEPLQ
jgi:hypothetical protein